MTAPIDLSGNPMRYTVDLTICGVRIGEVMIDRNAEFMPAVAALRRRVEQAMLEHETAVHARALDRVMAAMGGVR